MMSVLEYADDVKKTVSEIMELCNKLSIKVENADDMLSEDDIVILDNEIQDNEDYIVNEDEDDNEYNDDEFFEKVEELANETKLVTENVKKVKPKKEPKKETEEEKDTFKQDKKEMYKHRDKLMTNDDSDLENVILYKNNMTVSELANELDVAPSELIKKLMGLGIMSSLNNSVAFDVAELLVVDYDKTLKQEETQDISNFEMYEIVDNEENLEERPPVVTIMLFYHDQHVPLL